MQRAGQGVQFAEGGRDEDGRWSDAEYGPSSDDEDGTWITAATRERFGYCAWRVKRCLMKQVRARRRHRRRRRRRRARVMPVRSAALHGTPVC